MTAPTLRTGSSVPAKCCGCDVHAFGVCAKASPRLLERLSRASRIRHFKAGETIIADDDDAGLVGHVVDGVLRMQKTMPDGRQQIVGLLMPTDIFGRVFAERTNFALEAATDATLCCFDRSAFESILAQFPELEHDVLMSVLDELDAAREWMLLLGCQTVRERIASFLLIVARRWPRGLGPERGTGPTAEISIPISRQDMASYLGTRVETISRVIQSFAREGLIQILGPQRLEILDFDRLVEISGNFDLSDSDAIGRQKAVGEAS